MYVYVFFFKYFTPIYAENMIIRFCTNLGSSCNFGAAVIKAKQQHAKY